MRICQHNNCNHPVFGTDRKTKIGYCKLHQGHRTDLDKRSIASKSMSKAKQKRISSKIRSIGNFGTKIEYDLKLERYHELELWYDKMAKIIDKNPYCWNCGSFIPKTYYRAATAHVIPKRKNYGFPSVKTHESNYLVLGASCGCHGKYDNSWDDASKMKIWPMAVERFKLIFPFIHKSELKNIPDILSSCVEACSPNDI